MAEKKRTTWLNENDTMLFKDAGAGIVFKRGKGGKE